MIVIYWRESNQASSYNIESDKEDKYCLGGDARAILTPPMDVTTVEVYKRCTTAKMGVGDVYIGRIGTRVTDYEIHMQESLQALALKELICQNPKAMQARLKRSVNLFLRK
jgi:hypothetical protein